MQSAIVAVMRKELSAMNFTTDACTLEIIRKGKESNLHVLIN